MIYRWKLPQILATASVIGGLFFTLLSGLHMVKPFVMDAEIIYFGIPFTWLEAGRSTWVPNGRWTYYFFWQGFISNFMIYGLMTTATLYIYFKTVTEFRRLSLRHRVNLNTAESCSK